MGFVFPANPFDRPNIIVPLVMFGWPLFVLYLFTRMPARRALVFGFVGAWLFLPIAEVKLLPGFPVYTKTSATCYGVILATLLYDVGRFKSFRPGWVDIPMLLWCICPFFSSMANGLGEYDGYASVFSQVMTWGVPYFLGRVYLNSLEGLRLLAMGIFTGGLIYVPLCLFEIRFSPQLHRIVYGGHQGADFAQTIRLGGFRPTVFMQHGLAVGAFMMVAALVAVWFWRSNMVKQQWNMPMPLLTGVLVLTFFLCKSTGAYYLFALGAAILFVGRFLKTNILLYITVALMMAYLYVNALTETYFSDQLIDVMKQFVSDPDRLASMEFRFNNEELLVHKARQQIVFGWGGWGRNLIFDDAGNQITVTDSLWIIAFGQNGIFGLASLFASMLVPVVSLFLLHYPPSTWNNRKVVPVAVLGVATVMYMIDCMINAMINPLYILAVGGIAGLVLSPERLKQSAGSKLAAAKRRLVPQR